MSQENHLLSSADRVEPGSTHLRLARLPPCDETLKDIDPVEIAVSWVQSFNEALKGCTLSTVAGLFASQCHWRDHLCMTWDFHTFEGQEAIASLLENSKDGSCRIETVTLDQTSVMRSPTDTTLDGKLQVVQTFLRFETTVGCGAGVVRLVSDGGTWRAFTLYTFLDGLRGYEEPVGHERPVYLPDAAQNPEAVQTKVEVLVLGAGQAGLAVAARLKMLGVDTLVVDKNPRVGDNWRDRYAKLVLHDPVWFDHMPYFPFPDFWPVYSPKDKFADWLESYANFLELSVWIKTRISKATWDSKESHWTIGLVIERDGNTQSVEIQAKHIIQATGASGEPNIPLDIPGINNFEGSLVHSSRFLGAAPSHGKGKNAIVVGSCNSGHDIALNLHKNGYYVTMIQRSSTLVSSADSTAKSLTPLWCEDGPPIEDADLIFHSIPNSVLKRVKVEATAELAKDDAEILRGLEARGFRLDNGPNDSGLWMKYLSRGGGYYIDTGCSKLIVDGDIALKSGVSVASVTPRGVVLTDRTKLEADEIIFATGYQNMRTQTSRIFSPKLADTMGDVWGFDEEGEIRGLWRPNGHPGFWFMGGNLALCRWFSRLLALQILARLRGIKRDADV